MRGKASGMRRKAECEAAPEITLSPIRAKADASSRILQALDNHAVKIVGKKIFKVIGVPSHKSDKVIKSRMRYYSGIPRATFPGLHNMQLGSSRERPP